MSRSARARQPLSPSCGIPTTAMPITRRVRATILRSFERSFRCCDHETRRAVGPHSGAFTGEKEMNRSAIILTAARIPEPGTFYQDASSPPGRGFTLIELLVVIAIIAILASLL